MYDIFFNLNDMHQPCDDDEIDYYFEGEQLVFFPDEIEKVSGPLTCPKCLEIYPYAVPNQKDGSFICYSCRVWG